MEKRTSKLIKVRDVSGKKFNRNLTLADVINTKEQASEFMKKLKSLCDNA